MITADRAIGEERKKPDKNHVYSQRLSVVILFKKQ